MPTPTVAAEALRVIDGDSIVVTASIWPGITAQTEVRLAGVDTPELHSSDEVERHYADLARAEVQKLLPYGATVYLCGVKRDKYGERVVASVLTSAGVDISEHLIKKGLGRPYDGGHKPAWAFPIVAGVK